MKKIVILVIILVVLVITGYIGKTLMAPTAPQTQTVSNQPSPSSSAAMVPSDNIYLIKIDPSKGAYLTDFQGMTLYTFDKDTIGVSNCEGACLKAWPVYTSGATAQKTFPENISVITRSDGSQQFAWKGMPLYYYVSDAKTGDITGDGVGGVWHIVKP